MSRLKKTTVRFLVVVAAALLLSFAFRTWTNSATVTNKSGVAIKSLMFRVGNSTRTVRDLKDGDSFSTYFQAFGDGQLEVEGYFFDGRKIEGKDGYVTNSIHGDRFQAVIDVSGNFTVVRHMTIP